MTAVTLITLGHVLLGTALVALVIFIMLQMEGRKR
jgi:hypothetical protein